MKTLPMVPPMNAGDLVEAKGYGVCVAHGPAFGDRTRVVTVRVLRTATNAAWIDDADHSRGCDAVDTVLPSFMLTPYSGPVSERLEQVRADVVRLRS